MSMPPRYYKVEGKKVTCADVAERLNISHPAAHKRLRNALERSTRLTWRDLGEGARLSRAQQILRFVIGLGRPAKLDEIVDAIEPLEAKKTSRANVAMTVAAQLAQLHKAGKLTREGTRCHFTYLPTAKTLVDRRKTAVTGPAKPKAAAPSPVTKALRQERKQAPEPKAALEKRPRRVPHRQQARAIRGAQRQPHPPARFRTG